MKYIKDGYNVTNKLFFVFVFLQTVPEETPPIIDQVSTTTTTTDERPQINQNVAMSSGKL